MTAPDRKEPKVEWYIGEMYHHGRIAIMRASDNSQIAAAVPGPDTIDETRERAKLLASAPALAAEVARLREALQKSAELIESEYCSHPGPHAANNKYCYTDFIYAALARAEGDGNG